VDVALAAICEVLHVVDELEIFGSLHLTSDSFPFGEKPRNLKAIESRITVPVDF
jgi:hypothetical protein